MQNFYTLIFRIVKALFNLLIYLSQTVCGRLKGLLGVRFFDKMGVLFFRTRLVISKWTGLFFLSINMRRI